MFTRHAGEGLDLQPDVVVYMGKAAQGMPQDEGMDRRIAEGMMNAIGQAVNMAPLGEISHGGSTPYKPIDSESMKRLREPGSPMPKDVRDEILRNLAGMRKA